MEEKTSGFLWVEKKSSPNQVGDEPCRLNVN
jgi:hypothetical protein